MDAKDKLPRVTDPWMAAPAYTARESWRIFGIMAEFVEATERLATVRPAVSFFGSARVGPESPHYVLAEKLGRLLSDAGFSLLRDAAAPDDRIVVVGIDEATVASLSEPMTLWHRHLGEARSRARRYRSGCCAAACCCPA